MNEKPLGAMLDTIHKDLENYTFAQMQKYELPPSLMDYILARVQVTIKEMKNSEYAQIIAGTPNIEIEHGEEKGSMPVPVSNVGEVAADEIVQSPTEE